MITNDFIGLKYVATIACNYPYTGHHYQFTPSMVSVIATYTYIIVIAIQ